MNKIFKNTTILFLSFSLFLGIFFGVLILSPEVTYIMKNRPQYFISDNIEIHKKVSFNQEISININLSVLDKNDLNKIKDSKKILNEIYENYLNDLSVEQIMLLNKDILLKNTLINEVEDVLKIKIYKVDIIIDVLE